MTRPARNPRAEASARVGNRFDVRVLEPSPPAVNQPPYFDEAPLAGGEVVPVVRAGARSWAELCETESQRDPGLVEWCQDRWLVRGVLGPLPHSFVSTRRSLHAVAEHLLAPLRHSATGRIGLRFTHHGFGTPFFGDDRQARLADGVLFDDHRQHSLTTLGAAADFLGMEAGAPEDVYRPTTPLDLDAPLAIDPVAGRSVGNWFGFCASLLEQMRADAIEVDAPARVQLWPEHFDLAVDLGPLGSRANYGGSPGDEAHPGPYLYVGPHDGREGAFWNESFGASLSYQSIREGTDPLAFLRHGKELLLR